MLQAEFLTDLRNFTVRVKERASRNRPTDLLPFAVCYRGNTRVARLTFGGPVEEQMQNLAVAVNMFDADQLGYVSEAVQSTPDHSINPLTGRPWERGELSDAVAKHDAFGKGWAVEILIVTAINRADDLASLTLPFRYVGGKHLTWQEDGAWDTRNLSADGEGHVLGLVPELLHHMMSQSSAQVVLDRLPPNVPADQKERDVYTARLLGGRPRVMVELFT